MSRADLLALLPLLLLAGTVPAVLLLVSFRRAHAPVAALTFAGLAASLAALPLSAARGPRQVAGLFVLDGCARWYMGLMLAAGCAVTLIAYDYFGRRAGRKEEFYLLLLLATLGGAVLAASSHFVSLFLGLEILSVSLYALVSFRRTSRASVDAGITYLVLAAVSTALLLFGMALVYLDCGGMSLYRAAPIRPGAAGGGALLAAGAALLIAGFGFKLALVPFHMWVPQVYGGAPPPAAALIASVSKGAAFVVLLRALDGSVLFRGAGAGTAITALAAASMICGNILALREERVTRILAYSSIAHMGYLLTALRAGGALAATAAAYYLAAYFTAIIGAFCVVTLREGRGGAGDTVADYRGFGWRHPWLGGAFAAMLFSLAGMPLTVGFVGKFYLFAAGVGSNLVPLTVVLAATSAVGLFYYLRVILALYDTPGAEGAVDGGAPPVSPAGFAVLSALTIVTVVLGACPGPLLRLIQSMLGNAA